MLDNTGDLAIMPKTTHDGLMTGVILGDTLFQDTAIVLGLNQGEYKEDPALGPNLIRHIRGHSDRLKMDKQIRIHLLRAGIDYDAVKERINVYLKKV